MALKDIGKRIQEARKGKDGEQSNAVDKTRELAEKGADKIKKIAVGTKKATAALAVLKNPITLIILAIVATIIILAFTGLGVMKTVGSGEACPQKRSDGVSAASEYEYSDDPEVRMQQMGSFLMGTNFKFLGDRPMSVNEAAGVVSNFAAESGVNTLRPEGTFTKEEAEKIKDNDKAREWAKSRNTTQQCTAVYPNGVGNGIRPTACNGLGLAQWTHYPGRAKDLIDLADEMGKGWWEPDVQFEMIKRELEESYGKRLLNPGGKYKPFSESTSPEDNAQTFHYVYEGTTFAVAEHKAAANTVVPILENQPGYQKGSSAECEGGSGPSLSEASGDIVEFTLKTAMDGKAGCFDTSNKVLMDAAQLAYDNTKKHANRSSINGRSTMCDCGAYVSVVLRGSGFDPAFPDIGTMVQYPYMKKNPDKYEEYTNYEDRQPGDIIVTDNGQAGARGHIYIYLGEVNGKESVAQASLQTHDAEIMPHWGYKNGPGNTCVIDSFGSRSYACFRPIGGKK